MFIVVVHRESIGFRWLRFIIQFDSGYLEQQLHTCILNSQCVVCVCVCVHDKQNSCMSLELDQHWGGGGV